MQTLTEIWQEQFQDQFDAHNVPKNFNDEMKKAFFAGALSLHNILMDATDNDLPPEVGGQLLKDLEREAVETLMGMKGVILEKVREH